MARRAIAPDTRGDTGERAYRRLRAAIVHGEIEPGARLVESALCDWLEVSRTPVREALRRLKTDGLVEDASGGLRVTRYDMAALNELYVVREVLEATAAAEAARHATAAEVDAMKASLRIQVNLTNDVVAFSRENVVFHRQLYDASRNRFLVRTLQALSDAVALLGPTAIDSAAAAKRAVAQHTRIVAAIAARNPDRAFEATREHIRSGLESRARAFRRHVPAGLEHGS